SAPAQSPPAWPMTKPWAFAYSDEEWDVIRRELPAGVATNEKRTDIERRVRRWLDEAASHFASLKKAEHKRPAAPHWSVYRGIARDLERVLPKVKADGGDGTGNRLPPGSRHQGGNVG